MDQDTADSYGVVVMWWVETYTSESQLGQLISTKTPPKDHIYFNPRYADT